MCKESRVEFRIDSDINSRLNKLCGESNQDRSKIARLALLDMLNGTNFFRRQVLKSIQTNAQKGHGLIIQEII